MNANYLVKQNPNKNASDFYVALHEKQPKLLSIRFDSLLVFSWLDYQANVLELIFEFHYRINRLNKKIEYFYFE